MPIKKRFQMPAVRLNHAGLVPAFVLVLSAVSPLTGSQDAVISGEGTIRMRYIQTDSAEITGSYGEVLKKGLSFRQRMQLALFYPIMKHLIVEAGIRISNEDVDYMLPPPYFVSTDVLAGWWSVNFDRNPLLVSFGSYETSFTPLTLMRWDTSDNPLAASGCACQISVGGIGGESLEEPQENYRLEGAKAEVSGDIGDVKAVFARTQMAKEGEGYARYLYGTRCRLVLTLPLFPVVSVGGTLLRAQDDIESVDIAVTNPLRSDAGSIDLRVPCPGGCKAVAELALSRRDDNLLSNTDAVREGYGIIGGVQFQGGDQIDAHALYLQMDPYFSPLYRALSYAKNRRGARVSFTHRAIVLFGRRCIASVYLKKLKEIEPTWLETITEWHGSRSDFLVANGGLNVAVTGNIKTEFDYEFRSTDRADDAATLNDELLNSRTHVASGSLIYEFTMQSKLTFKYQYVRNVDRSGGPDYSAHMPGVQFSMKF